MTRFDNEEEAYDAGYSLGSEDYEGGNLHELDKMNFSGDCDGSAESFTDGYQKAFKDGLTKDYGA